MSRRAWIVVDLGFGDAGKGGVTDFLARDQRADLVVRFNGGAQAGHNVVTPDGRHHTFSQFGAGTFAGVRTALGPAFLLHPLAMVVEAEHLVRAGDETKLPDFLRHLVPMCAGGDPVRYVHRDPSVVVELPIHEVEVALIGDREVAQEPPVEELPDDEALRMLDQGAVDVECDETDHERVPFLGGSACGGVILESRRSCVRSRLWPSPSIGVSTIIGTERKSGSRRKKPNGAAPISPFPMFS